MRIYDEDALRKAVDDAINGNAHLVLECIKGKPEAFTQLLREAMRNTDGMGDPSTVRKLLEERLGK